MVDLLAVERVARADLDAIEAVENIELRQRQSVDATGAHGLTYEDRVKPAAAAGPAGIGAELAASFTYLAADCIVLLGRERALADAGRVGLAEAEHVADGTGPEAGAGCGLSRDCVGRRDVGVSAMIDIEQCALRTLEQHALALTSLDVQEPPHRLGIRQQLRCQRRQLGQNRLAIELR